jgi:O-antigen/teichoic acid export membrane protein
MHSASKNIFWLSLSRALALVLLFLAYTQLFRYLGRFGTGQHQFVLSYVTIFSVIVDFGIQQYIIKKISENPGDVKKYFQHFLVVEAVLASFIYGVLLLVAKLNHYEPVVFLAIAVAGFGMVMNALTYPFLSVMSAFQDLKKVAFLNFLQSVVNIVVIFAAIFFHHYIVFLVTNQLIFAALSLYLYSRFFRKHVPEPGFGKIFRSLDTTLIKKILKASLPFALLVGFSTIYNRIDVVIITKLLGYEQTGIYTAAYKFFDLISFFPSVVSFSLYPLFAALMAKSAFGEVRENMEKYLRFLIAVAIPMAVGGSILAGPIIRVVAGPDFPQSAPVLAILVWAPAILFIYIAANSLVISQLTKFAVMITGANVVINIVGNLLLIPYIGLKGAAVMTVVSELLQGVFYFYFVRKKITHFAFFRFFWKPILASLVMAAVLWVTRSLPILIPITFGGSLYVLAMYVFGFFKKEDWHFIKSLIKKEPAQPITNP